MLSTESLEAAGYRKHLQSPETIKDAAFLLQKRFRDEAGETRYFITVFVYDFSKFADRVERFKTNPWSFSPQVQFRGGDVPTIDVSYHADDDTTVEAVEEFYDRLWQFLGKPYSG